MKRSLLLFFLLAIGYQSAEAQKRRIKFTKINMREGAEIGQVNDIVQDKNGFIWLSEESSGCITRYDGQNLKRYYNIPDDSTSLGGNYPECLFIDDDGAIWIGFYGQGLDRFDPISETFTHFRHDSTKAAGLSSDFVTDILRDHLGNLWVGTYGGLDLLDSKTGTFTHYQHRADDVSSLSSNYVRELYEDRQGVLWVGTGWLAQENGGLNRFERSTEKFIRYMPDAKNPSALADKRITSIFEDSHSNFWVGTGTSILHLMDREKGTFKRLEYDPRKPNQLSGPAIINADFGINFINEDANGNLWIGSNNNGVNMYDPIDRTVTHFGDNTDASGTFIENTSWCFYVAKDGLIWLSTQPGLYNVDLFDYFIPRVNAALPSFLRQSDSVIWTGLNNGLIKENTVSGSKKKWTYDPLDSRSISCDTISAILLDHRNQLWVGTTRGLNRINLNNNTLTRFTLKYKFSNGSMSVADYVTVLYEDADEELWVGTADGLYKFDRSADAFQYADILLDGETGYVSSLTDGIKGELWIGFRLSITRLNKITGETMMYRIGNGVNYIYKDASGEIWATSPVGLHRYDAEVGNFRAWSNSPMVSIVEDANHNLWVSSRSYVLRINEKRDLMTRFLGEYSFAGTVYSIGTDGGIFGGLNSNSLRRYIDNDGKIYLGDDFGYYVFNPDSIKAPPDTSRLFFTNFWVGEKLAKPGENEPLQHSLFETNQIFLHYNQNVFSITFTEIDFRSNGRNKISYKLENYDFDWRETDAENKVTYVKVPPGEYTLRIKALNSSTGLWVENNMAINISPPWWLTWWAYSFYGALFIAGVFTVDRIQRRRLIMNERERSREKELHQAKEIEKAYHELKAAQSQLIQSEKMASLGELTAGIAHEIQNPLNFVNNFSEVSNELIHEMKTELATGNLQQVTEIADDIKQNLEKINHHGKRADAIVKGMLQHSRASSGKKEPTDINALCDEYLRLAYHGLRAKDKSFNAKFETHLDPTLPKVNVVPQDIGRVILNLINNAFYAVNEKVKSETSTVKADSSHVSPFTSRFEALVTVTTKNLGNKIEISVKDYGPGIPDSIKEKIFQPFFTTKPTGQGTGLGLSLSYDIVKAHGGELNVETNEGEGTTFIIKPPAT
jgi:signal transduction histidine kinase/ligand-binding sensor domain-containing protein